ncbi:MAG: tetratricopeptide repeat protein [Bacteroidia bacterium]
MRYTGLILFFALASFSSLAQDPLEDKIADLLSRNDLKDAVPVYRKLIQKHPENEEYKYQLGKCLLKTHGNRQETIKLLETTIEKRKPDAEAFYCMGQAYQHDLQFDKAMEFYTKAKAISSKSQLAKVERQIETCLHAKELIRFPVNVTFYNLGAPVNSEYADYYPLIPDDESFLIFTSRRPGSAAARAEMDGYFPSDIYSATPKDGKWTEAKSLGNHINTHFDEEAVGLSPDGKKLTVYVDHIDSSGNLYLTEPNKTNTGFKKIERLDHKINEGFESTGSTNNAGDVFAFSSDRKGGMGEKDIYIIRKLPNGKWGEPQDLGDHINTKYSEDFPHLSKDGKTIYFASEGHSSMGGYDLFKCEWNEETQLWSAPQNLGYPINDTYDNENISFVGDGAYAYVSTIKDGGLGDRDIYKIKFNEIDTRYCIITGYVTTSDSSEASIKISILASKPEMKETLKFVPVQKTGKYVMALTPGDYTLSIKADGYEEVVTKFVIYDLPFQPERAKDFSLKRKP